MAQLTPETAIAEMGRGINLGNTLEPPTEGAWNNGPAQEHYFDDYVAAGFATVRIPVRWDEHTADAAPYAVNASWMNRVEQVVDWALARGLYVVLNAHHEDWLKQNYSNTATRARFDSIWVQVADRFQNKSDSLLFEIINEPFGMTRAEVDDLNARILGLIRETNPTRFVIFSGDQYSNAEQLVEAAIPDPDDDYLLAYFHSYDPWNFAGQGQGGWGDADHAFVASKFQSVANWSNTHGIPVMISEFGAVRENRFNDRMRFYAGYVEEAIEHNMAFQVWDDGGMFQLYQRDDRDWYIEKDILIHFYPDSPTDLTAAVSADTAVVLTWENRTRSRTSLIVERRRPGGAFDTLATLPATASSFADTSYAGLQTYEYRILATVADAPTRYSYPFQITTPPKTRSAFPGDPHPIPGTIQAEDFDTGGEGLTFHDTDAENVPGAYRTDTGVDIEARDDGGFQVTDVVSGEWLEYTVDVQEAGRYEITAYIASVDGGGRFEFVFGDEDSGILRPVSTGSEQTLAAISTTMDLDAGEQVFRMDLLTAFPYNVDRYTFTRVQDTGRETLPEPPAFEVFPNPAHTEITIRTPTAGPGQQLELYNLLGQRVRQAPHADGPLSLEGLPSGLYLLRLVAEGHAPQQTVFVKH